MIPRDPANDPTLDIAAAEAPTLLPEGELQFGRYAVIERIGSGGMGEVFRGRHVDLGREVAIKLLKKVGGEAISPALAERFRREAEISARLDHPAVVRVHDVGSHPLGMYMVMDLVDGEPLDQLLGAGPLAPERALELARQVADALAEAHAAGIVHRDIKPQNIMVDRRGAARLLDFGIAALKGADHDLTRTGALIGTPKYMSPEQLGSSKVDARSDIWSLGVVLYEMLTGEQPFEGETMFAVIAKVGEVDPTPPSRARKGIPVGVDKVVRGAMTRDLARRTASAAELAAALQALLDGKPPVAGRGSGPRRARGSGTRPAAREGRGSGPQRARSAGRRSSARQSAVSRRPQGLRGGGSGLIYGIGAVVGVLLLVVIALLATGPRGAPAGPPVAGASSTPPPSSASTSSSRASSSRASSSSVRASASSDPPADPALARLRRRLVALRAQDQASPADLSQRLRAWRSLARDAAGTELEEDIAQELVILEQQQKGAARELFARLDAEAKRLAAAGDLAGARAVYSRFDADLLTPEWREQIAQARAALTGGVASSSAALPRNRHLDDTRQLPRMAAPPGIKVPADFKEELLSALQVAFERGGRFAPLPKQGGTLLTGGFYGAGYIEDRKTKTEYELVDYYLSIELLILRGRFIIHPRLPSAADKVPGAKQHEIGVPKPPDDRGWFRVHVLVQGRRTTFWIDGQRDALKFDTTYEKGALQFLVEPGSQVALRRISLFAKGRGRARAPK